MPFAPRRRIEEKKRKKRGGKIVRFADTGLSGTIKASGSQSGGGGTMKMTQLSARVYKEFDFRRGNSSIDPCPFRVCERESR